jgi:homospermidine synthase
MIRPKGTLKIYTVVEVWRGMAASARSFRRLANARNYARRLRRRSNLQNDDVQIFLGMV